jgi:hypothetical protein
MANIQLVSILEEYHRRIDFLSQSARR